MLPSTAALSTQQLAEFLAAVSCVPDGDSAIRVAAERAARTLEAEVAAVLGPTGVASSVGFRIGAVPVDELAAVADGSRSVLDVPGAGPCHTVVAPLAGRAPGHLVVARSGDDGFSVDETSLVRGMARVLELTVETMYTFEAERRQAAENTRLLASLQERHRLLEQLSEVQRAITRRAPLQEILDAITGGAQALLGDEVAGLRLFDPDDPEMLLLVSAKGLPADLTRRLWRIPVDQAGATGQAARSGQLVVVNQYARSPLRIPQLVAIDIQSAMAAPVHNKEKVIGGLVVASYRPDRYYTPSDQQALRVFAEQVSLAVTDAKTQEAMHQAFHDSLTGLASRGLFMDRLEYALACAQRDRTQLAVLFVDLDRFKVVNDSLGHTAGDRVLIGVADRLRSSLRANDTAARLGGDEFAVVIDQVADPSDAVAVGNRIIEALEAPFVIEGREVFVNASIGIAFNTEQSIDGHDLIRNADLAMYQAKRNGKGRCEIFEATAVPTPIGRLDLEAELHRGLSRDEFVLHYQPVVDLRTGAAVGVEALVRWQHPERGLVPPSQFVPLAEETGLILPLGRWVLHEACRQASEWNVRRDQRPPLTISVNVSARQLNQPDLPDIVAAALAESGLDPALLMLEITESLLLRDTEATVEVLRRLGELRVHLAIDDFGTGYSSLTHLHRFPVDTIKLDRSFVREIPADAKASALVRAVVQLGDMLGLTTIAEGIEAVDQFDQLRAAGCGLGQGYLFAKPLEPHEIEALPAMNGHRPGRLA
ncbi:MAG TPA: EAL domain-containing protein [Pilimelia sp.]|nr:EAL domain-containing protein [Pilimelia sp.]